MDTLVAAQGRFILARYPARKNEPLRAWDATDESVLRFMATERAGDKMGTTLIVNDGWGALATALASPQTFSFGDSYVAYQRTRRNLAANLLDARWIPEAIVTHANPPNGPPCSTTISGGSNYGSAGHDSGFLHT